MKSAIIKTVLDYNASQASAAMKMLTKSGSEIKKGFVAIEENGDATFYKTLEAANNHAPSSTTTDVLPSVRIEDNLAAHTSIGLVDWSKY